MLTWQEVDMNCFTLQYQKQALILHYFLFYQTILTKQQGSHHIVYHSSNGPGQPGKSPITGD